MKDDDSKDPMKRKNDAPESDGSGADSNHKEWLRAAMEHAAEAARQIALQICTDERTSRKEIHKVVGAFRSALLPKRRLGGSHPLKSRPPTKIGSPECPRNSSEARTSPTMRG